MRRLAPLLLSACVTTTGGERVTFHARAQGLGEATWTDETTGWTWTLTEATAWLGPLYFWSEEPRLDPSGLARAGRLPTSTDPLADQFRAGFLVGEVTDQVAVDLLGDPVELPDGDGLAGASRSAELWLEPVSATVDTLTYRGVATRGDVTVAFTGGMTVDEDQVVQDDDIPTQLRRLRGLLWTAELADGGTVTLTADPRRWFDGADPSTLADAPTDAAGDAVVAPLSDVGRIVYARSRRIGADGPWSFTWTPPEDTP